MCLADNLPDVCSWDGNKALIFCFWLVGSWQLPLIDYYPALRLVAAATQWIVQGGIIMANLAIRLPQNLCPHPKYLWEIPLLSQYMWSWYLKWMNMSNIYPQKLCVKVPIWHFVPLQVSWGPFKTPGIISSYSDLGFIDAWSYIQNVHFDLTFLLSTNLCDPVLKLLLINWNLLSVCVCYYFHKRIYIKML